MTQVQSFPLEYFFIKLNENGILQMRLHPLLEIIDFIYRKGLKIRIFMVDLFFIFVCVC